MTGPMLDRLQIAGYRSIEECDLRLGRVNVVVGSNGAGKSNLLSALGLLGSMVNRSLQQVVEQSGGPATLLRGGLKVTKRLRLHATFGQSAYEVVLAEHRDGATSVHRPEQAALRSSIEERSLGQWWIQHLLDGAPGRDSTP